MIVGLLSSKATLSPKLVKTWIQTIAEIAQEDAEKSTGLQWFRLSIITLISLVQVVLCLFMPLHCLKQMIP